MPLISSSASLSLSALRSPLDQDVEGYLSKKYEVTFPSAIFIVQSKLSHSFLAPLVL